MRYSSKLLFGRDPDAGALEYATRLVASAVSCLSLLLFRLVDLVDLVDDQVILTAGSQKKKILNLINQFIFG